MVNLKVWSEFIFCHRIVSHKLESKSFSVAFKMSKINRI